eukprot:4124668-Ditylum_brightwellii.AAC.1
MEYKELSNTPIQPKDKQQNNKSKSITFKLKCYHKETTTREEATRHTQNAKVLKAKKRPTRKVAQKKSK